MSRTLLARLPSASRASGAQIRSMCKVLLHSAGPGDSVPAFAQRNLLKAISKIKILRFAAISDFLAGLCYFVGWTHLMGIVEGLGVSLRVVLARKESERRSRLGVSRARVRLTVSLTRGSMARRVGDDGKLSWPS